MKSTQVEVGATYSAKVSGQLVPVRIESEAVGGGYWGRNLQTSRTIRLRSARRLRSLLVGPEPQVVFPSDEAADARRYELVEAPKGRQLPRWVVAAMNDRYVPGTWEVAVS